MQRRSFKIMLSGGLLAATLALTAAVALPTTTLAQTDTTATATPAADTTTDSTRPARSGRSASETGRLGGSNDQYLADALGITLAELQTAKQTAQTAAIDQALSQGLITQAQADALKAGTGRGSLHGLLKGAESEIDTTALLAQALNITTDELADAQAEAKATALAAAVADGRITQAQADLATAQQALRTYIDDNNIYERIVSEAVSAGVLTQAQADALVAAQGTHSGFDGFGGGSHGRRGGR